MTCPLPSVVENSKFVKDNTGNIYEKQLSKFAEFAKMDAMDVFQIKGRMMRVWD